jgi:SAM-dependent methyltransferase
MVCSNKNLHTFLSLGDHPPSDTWLTKEMLSQQQQKFPLTVLYCDNCGLVQLGYVTPAESMFSNFIYTTSSNISLVTNFRTLAFNVTNRFELKREDLVLDIGSNDGTELEAFRERGMRILGVEPSRAVSAIALRKGIPTINDFFNRKLADRILADEGRATVITAMNVFAHVRELNSIVSGVRNLLADRGVVIVEVHYLLDLIKESEFDSIYLEHLRYYSLRPLIYLFDKFGLEIFDAERIDTHGGSLRVFVCKAGNFPVQGSVAGLLEQEEKFGLYSLNTFRKFGQRTILLRQQLREFVLKAKESGSRVVGLGAPAKGNTMLNYCEFDTSTIDYLAEREGSLKIGRFAPGSLIPVKDESEIFRNEPDYLLLLSWNLAEYIVPKLREQGYKGRIIVPIPEPRLI